MTERYRVEAVGKNLERGYGAKLIKSSKENDTSTLVYQGKTTTISTPGNWVYDSGIIKIGEFIGRERKEEPTEINANITKSASRGLERAINSALILSLFSFLFLLLEKINITGFTIGNISNSTLNIGILICAVIAIVLYLFRLRYK